MKGIKSGALNSSEHSTAIKGKMAEKKYIYLIEEQDRFKSPTGYYKAGSTNNKKRRMRELQTGNPRRLVMIHCTKYQLAESTENTVHEHLNDAVGIRHCEATEDGGTEWYFTQEDSTFMKRSFKNGLGEVSSEDVHIAHD